MRKSPSEGLEQLAQANIDIDQQFRRNEEKPERGIGTLRAAGHCCTWLRVGMRKSPSEGLEQLFLFFAEHIFLCRNEEKPERGIGTAQEYAPDQSHNSRNEEKPERGIGTAQEYAPDQSHNSRNEEKPERGIGTSRLSGWARGRPPVGMRKSPSEGLERGMYRLFGMGEKVGMRKSPSEGLERFWHRPSACFWA